MAKRAFRKIRPKMRAPRNAIGFGRKTGTGLHPLIEASQRCHFRQRLSGMQEN